MFTYFRQAYSVFFQSEAPSFSNSLNERWEKIPKLSENDEQLSVVFWPRNLWERKDQQNMMRQERLIRASVSEQIVKSNAWPPETHVLIQSEKLTSHQIIDEKNKNTSELLTHIYTRLIANFEKHGLSHPDATKHAANFMREYSYQLQWLISANTEPQVLKKTIQDSVEQYRWDLMKTPKDTTWIIDPTLSGMASPEDYDTSFGNPGPVAKPREGILPIDADLFWEEDHEFEKKIMGYTESVRQVRDYEREHQVSPEEVASEKISPDHLDTLRIPPSEFDATLRDERIDSPESITTIPEGKSQKIQLIDESGVSDIMCTHLKNGDYILQFPTGESIVIDSNGNPEKAKKEIAFIQEIVKTPIIRRLLMNGNGKFQDFRVKFEKEFPWREIDTHPELFIRKVLDRIIDAMSAYDPEMAWAMRDACSSTRPISDIQQFLRNNRDNIIPLLHKTWLIPRDGVQKLYAEKLL